MSYPNAREERLFHFRTWLPLLSHCTHSLHKNQKSCECHLIVEESLYSDLYTICFICNTRHNDKLRGTLFVGQGVRTATISAVETRATGWWKEPPHPRLQPWCRPRHVNAFHITPLQCFTYSSLSNLRRLWI